MVFSVFYLKNQNILVIDKINLKIFAFDRTTLKLSTMIHSVSKEENSALVIMGHSGIGINAVFNDLDKLSIGDEVTIYLKDKKYKYIIYEIYMHQKEEKLKIINNNKYLYLVTCDKKDMKKQLIICAKLVKIAEN